MAATLRALLVGLAAGLVSGLFGVGGGVIVVPALVLWLRLDQKRASATSLATIAVAASAALVLFGAESAVDWPAAAALFVGSAIGATAGARYLDRIPHDMLVWGFAGLMLLAAVRLAWP